MGLCNLQNHLAFLASILKEANLVTFVTFFLWLSHPQLCNAGGVADSPEGCAAIHRDLDRLRGG